jgi:hypothetical protein
MPRRLHWLVAFQDRHDAKGVESLLLDSPQFLWITGEEAVWGRDAAVRQFEKLYRDIWRLEPVSSEFRVVVDGRDVAQVFVPVVFTTGKEGQPPVVNRFLVNQTLVKTSSGWRIASILPIPAAEPVPEKSAPPK